MSSKTGKMRFLVSSLFIFLFSLFLSPSCTSLDFLSPNQSLKDGQTLVSEGGNFELGFFSPGTSKNRYVGIWYTNVQSPTVVWVANRENPLTDSSGILSIGGDGNLVILDGSRNTLWSSSISTTSKNLTAMLLGSSNLILTEGASANGRRRTLWQSFDHPTDTFMAKMKVGVYLETGKQRSITSWKSEDDPAPGKFSFGLERQKVPQLFLYNGSRRIWRSGQWNGRMFVGLPHMTSDYLKGFALETDTDEGMMYLTYDFPSLIARYVVDWSGMLRELILREDTKDWFLNWWQSNNQCDVYGMCGSFGSCNPSNLPICACLRGFQPKSAEEWGKGNWSGGCVRRTQLQCEKPGNISMMDGEGEGFLKMEMVKLPDFADWLDVPDAEGCEAECLKNCSCVAYAHVSEIGCMIWADGMIDIQEFSSGGEELYIRLDNSELGDKEKLPRSIIIVITIIGIAVLLGSAYLLWMWTVKNREKKKNFWRRSTIKNDVEEPKDLSVANVHRDGGNHGKGFELPLFHFAGIRIATDNFSDENKIGKGGFGPVYKGKLLGGEQVVAVKRLSERSNQGVEEFKNEILLISKLQHRNLVRLLGYCVEGDEKILIYEYMLNKSLDAFLFDPSKQPQLDWAKRFKIIEGIARGLLYLHRDSRLRVIHRDLKASNILLDGEMNPKISDFGMAKIFGGNQNLANTNRVVGTYGYMAPEYAMEGRFSEKSDVFSFGVLLLEIVSGKKNNSFYYHEHFLNLLGYAWRLWKEDKILELMDPSMGDPCSMSEVLRCIHVGLLCVQECETDRPSMSSVVLMLGQSTSLPTPNQPAFSLGRSHVESHLSPVSNGIFSVNQVTMTMIVDGRALLAIGSPGVTTDLSSPACGHGWTGFSLMSNGAPPSRPSKSNISLAATRTTPLFFYLVLSSTILRLDLFDSSECELYMILSGRLSVKCGKKKTFKPLSIDYRKTHAISSFGKVQRLGEADGSVTSNLSDIRSAAVDFFEQLFREEPTSLAPDLLSAIPSLILQHDNESFLSLPSKEEVHAAILSIPQDGAPGPDGFTAAFFSACWEIVGNDIHTTAHSFFLGDPLPRAFTSTLIWAFLSKLISAEQAAFVKGRAITENIVLANEALVGKIAGSLFLLTARRRVSSNLLEVSAKSFNTLVARGWVPPFKLHCGSPLISHLLFVNDTLLFLNGSRSSLLSIKHFLQVFQMPAGRVRSIQRLLGISKANSGIPYLGVPLSKGRLKQVNYFSGGRRRPIRILFPVIDENAQWEVGDSELNLWEVNWTGQGPLHRLATDPIPADLLVLFLEKEMTSSLELKLRRSEGIGSQMRVFGAEGEQVNLKRISFQLDRAGPAVTAGHASSPPASPLHPVRIVVSGCSPAVVILLCSAWNLCRSSQMRKDWSRWIWHSTLPPRISVFVWRLLPRVIPLDEDIQKRGMSLASCCDCSMNSPSSCRSVESCRHVFINSPAAAATWAFFGSIFTIFSNTTLSIEARGNLGPSGGRGICRNEVGDFIFGFSAGYGPGSNVFAELRAIHDGLSYYATLGHQKNCSMRIKTGKLRFLLFSYLIFLFSLSLSPSCTSLNFLSLNQSLKDGQTLVSEGGNFELGFFSPGTSKSRYVGIWYVNVPVQTVVWVANRENPLIDSSGVLSIGDDGNLVVIDGSRNTLWSSNISTTSKNSTAMLLDSSNFILTEGVSANSRGRTLWQSFDHPTDTIMPKMKIGVYLETGKKQFLTSWKNADDPAPGKFSVGLEQKIPQVFLYNGSRPIWRSGQWNGQVFVGIPNMNSVYLNGFSLEPDRDIEGVMYLSFDSPSTILRYMVDRSGIFKEVVLREDRKDWLDGWSQSVSQCDFYGMCGFFGSCNPSNSPICECLRGFRPKSAEEWGKGNWSGGCVRKTQLQCERDGNSSMMVGEGDGFLKMGRMKLPDFAHWLDVHDAKGCEAECLKNCSCVAYAYVSGIDCMIWVDSLIDIQEFSSKGEELCIRLANSELGDKEKLPRSIIIVITIIGIAVLLGSAYLLWMWTDKNREKKKNFWRRFTIKNDVEEPKDLSVANVHRDGGNHGKGFELPLFHFAGIRIATDNFSDENKIGKGGFGPVYKGKLLGGEQVVAVKRLSERSNQGVEEFKNEILLISKLQHRNLVRLLGYCVEGDEKILIYEYMPNKSLDAFLFDPSKQPQLDWAKRFKIIEGIARGLLYLHRDSRLRVIHRDLKASNILLDGDMNPKISDFGMAKIFGGNQNLANTNRVVGTYGYMAPEYAMEGRFSEKSDVFSFGVLLLEIVTGKKNNSFYYHEHFLNLLGYAWRLWKEDKILELMDPSMGDPCSMSEVLRCIHVGLLCVQECETDRPSMSSVVLMLGQSTSLPTPNQPAFSLGRSHVESHLSPVSNGIFSVNQVTMTMIVDGR
ncbi:uncharacterized protein LOC131223778 [Magnolia sinica]|uniref:uncharacterized protein LOC131223778 n=1 Tax=Magnolia sinica TaxID=86752 RepID=UPI0026593752|nr:uncharacterized protein LOC131223778 [Magnolia sinica]